MNPKISIIVANYNNADYLDDCIRSVVEQSFTDFECIIVDDGSKDDSRKIIRRWAKRDKRLRPIFQENRGVSAAHNAGIDVALGKYIGFLDSDDCFTPDALKILYTLAEQNNACIVGGGGMRVMDDFKLADATPDTNFTSPPFLVFASSPTEMIKMTYLGEAYRLVWVWRRLFRRELLEHVRFDEGLYPGEDTCFILEVMPLATRIVETKAIVVYHRVARTAVSSAPFNQKSIQWYPPTLRRLRKIMDAYYPIQYQRHFYHSFLEMMVADCVVRTMVRGRLGRQAANGLRPLYGTRIMPTGFLPWPKRLILWLFLRVF